MFKKSLIKRNCCVQYLPNGDKFVSGKGKFGTLIKKDGKIFDGMFSGGKLNGWGATRVQGSKNSESHLILNEYVGTFKCGSREGDGLMYFLDGIYEGNWKDNKRFGQGIMRYSNGAIYMGEWQDDKFHGHGVLLKVNGNRYEGAFSEGKRNGNGIYYHNNTGQIQKGIWHEDICKVSVIQDDDIRSQIALNPTPYPIPELKLKNPERIVSESFQHVSSMQ